MQKTLLTLILCSTASVWAHHHSKPLSFEELPVVCQNHFKHAQNCYDKAQAGQKLEFYRTNTKMLQGSLPAATVSQREQMCQIAEQDLVQKAKILHCE